MESPQFMPTPELIPYDREYEYQTASAFLEVFTIAPFSETLSLNNAQSQLAADSQRDGFGGILVRYGEDIVGFSWWFDISGAELHDTWRPRFEPKDQVPRPEGHGVFLNEFGIRPVLRNHGLGHKLFHATMQQIEPTHDWIALNTHNFAHAGLALLQSHAFVDLGLHGTQVTSRICMLKEIRR
jgi:GNAT superfamily N-acetyltransferase